MNEDIKTVKKKGSGTAVHIRHLKRRRDYLAGLIEKYKNTPDGLTRASYTVTEHHALVWAIDELEKLLEQKKYNDRLLR